jgi:hypothetical protein
VQVVPLGTREKSGFDSELLGTPSVKTAGEPRVEGLESETEKLLSPGTAAVFAMVNGRSTLFGWPPAPEMIVRGINCGEALVGTLMVKMKILSEAPCEIGPETPFFKPTVCTAGGPEYPSSGVTVIVTFAVPPGGRTTEDGETETLYVGVPITLIVLAAETVDAPDLSATTAVRVWLPMGAEVHV